VVGSLFHLIAVPFLGVDGLKICNRKEIMSFHIHTGKRRVLEFQEQSPIEYKLLDSKSTHIGDHLEWLVKTGIQVDEAALSQRVKQVVFWESGAGTGLFCLVCLLSVPLFCVPCCVLASQMSLTENEKSVEIWWSMG